MSQYYSDPKREADPYSLPDVEVFYADEGGLYIEGADSVSEAGWYYWACFPGCMPDGEPTGPFETEEEAVADMRYNWDLYY